MSTIAFFLYIYFIRLSIDIFYIITWSNFNDLKTVSHSCFLVGTSCTSIGYEVDFFFIFFSTSHIYKF